MQPLYSNKSNPVGNAHADGTDDTIWTTLADGTKIRLLPKTVPDANAGILPFILTLTVMLHSTSLPSISSSPSEILFTWLAASSITPLNSLNLPIIPSPSDSPTVKAARARAKVLEVVELVRYHNLKN